MSVVDDIADHPLPRLLEAGVRCTVSTDDPLCFANSLNEEYAALADELSFTRAELATVARNGWEVADVTEETRRDMLALSASALVAGGLGIGEARAQAPSAWDQAIQTGKIRFGAYPNEAPYNFMLNGKSRGFRRLMAEAWPADRPVRVIRSSTASRSCGASRPACLNGTRSSSTW